jgi:ATP phosphoribosyltransferase regulatory subunit
VFGRARPATGFSADLKMLAARTEAAALNGILAEGSLQDAGFADKVRALRDAGERVVLALTGADNDPQELGCQRRLVQDGSRWVIQDIS